MECILEISQIFVKRDQAKNVVFQIAKATDYILIFGDIPEIDKLPLQITATFCLIKVFKDGNICSNVFRLYQDSSWNIIMTMSYILKTEHLKIDQN